MHVSSLVLPFLPHSLAGISLERSDLVGALIWLPSAAHVKGKSGFPLPPKPPARGTPLQVVALIGELYEIERSIKRLDEAERLR